MTTTAMLRAPSFGSNVSTETAETSTTSGCLSNSEKERFSGLLSGLRQSVTTKQAPFQTPFPTSFYTTTTQRPRSTTGVGYTIGSEIHGEEGLPGADCKMSRAEIT